MLRRFQEIWRGKRKRNREIKRTLEGEQQKRVEWLSYDLGIVGWIVRPAGTVALVEQTLAQGKPRGTGGHLETGQTNNTSPPTNQTGNLYSTYFRLINNTNSYYDTIHYIYQSYSIYYIYYYIS